MCPAAQLVFAVVPKMRNFMALLALVILAFAEAFMLIFRLALALVDYEA